MNDYPEIQQSGIIFNEKGKLFILSEGLFNMNNSSIQMIDFETEKYHSDYFSTINQRGLGDTANDMIIYKGLIFVVVNVSSQIEVIDSKTGISVRRIPVMDEKGRGRQPRNIMANNEKLYVCSFDGTVSKIDLKSLEIEKTIAVGKNPDGLAISHGFLYVSNSGGLDAPNYDQTVSKIDIEKFILVKTIQTGINPFTIKSDNQGDVYVISRGNYGSSAATFQKIDLEDQTITVSDITDPTNFTIFNDTAYIYSYQASTGSFKLMTYDCIREKIINTDFLTGDFHITKPYGIMVHPASRRIYLTDAVNHTVKGDLYCFEADGKYLYHLKQIGLNPHAMVWAE
jgi:DNA-binding beta-propeller fold protein YncE